MTTLEALPAAVRERKALVYVRQSTPAQVLTCLESQRRQYELVEEARRYGFHAIEVIDDDPGRSASGQVERPGFERLVARLYAGEVGAVLCLEASRLARNGRDWHHLLELCGLVGARVIDLEGVYDPCRPNDRLLLGMKGSISAFELDVLRVRLLEAARAMGRPHDAWVTLTFVPIKSAEQRGRPRVHRARQGFVEERTATSNRIRGWLSEAGIVLPPKAATVRSQAAVLLEDLPG